MNRVTYSQQALATAVGVSRRRIARWVHYGLISPALSCRGVCEGRGYYTEEHVREALAVKKLTDRNTFLADLGRYLRETGQTVLTYRST